MPYIDTNKYGFPSTGSVGKSEYSYWRPVNTRESKTPNTRTGTMTRLMKCLPRKCEDLSSDPQNLCDRPGGAVYPIIVTPRGGDRRIPGAS